MTFFGMSDSLRILSPIYFDCGETWKLLAERVFKKWIGDERPGAVGLRDSHFFVAKDLSGWNTPIRRPIPVRKAKGFRGISPGLFFLRSLLVLLGNAGGSLVDD